MNDQTDINHAVNRSLCKQRLVRLLNLIDQLPEQPRDWDEYFMLRRAVSLLGDLVKEWEDARD